MSSGCHGCQTAADALRSVQLPGGWSLNHYGGTEGFFGWLALQPVAHRLTLRELSELEAETLGPNLVRLERGIYSYWQNLGEMVERVYIMYFLEGLLEGDNEWHLHIHLVPRFRRLAVLMPLQGGGIDAYLIAKLGAKLPAELDRSRFKELNDATTLNTKDLTIVRGVALAGGFTATPASGTPGSGGQEHERPR